MADQLDDNEETPLTAGYEDVEEHHEPSLPISTDGVLFSGFFFAAAAILLFVLVLPPVRMNPRFAFAGKQS